MIYAKKLGKEVALLRKVAEGGEGVVWQTNIPNHLAKIFKMPRIDIEEKLQFMCESPPPDPMLKHGHRSIAWPQDILLDKERARACGYLMPRVSGGLTLNVLYHPKLRRKKAPGFNWYYLHVAAMNISSIMNALHHQGYVIGDIKTDNFLATDQALVAVIDTDSFQVKTENHIFHCAVGSEGFTPPEAIGKDLTNLYRHEDQDLFGLGILIFLLLLGSHPFSGVWEGEGDPPSLDQGILSGDWVYGKESRMRPSPFALPFEILQPEIQILFRRLFDEGLQEPSKRPKASEWRGALEKAIESLKPCLIEQGHYFSEGKDCFWCERGKATGIDIFKSGEEGEGSLRIIHQFEEALDQKDFSRVHVLWSKYQFLHEYEPLTKKRKEISVALSYSETLNRFLEMCREIFEDDFSKHSEKGKNTVEDVERENISEADLSAFWLSEPLLESTPIPKDIKIGGRPLEDIVRSLKEYSRFMTGMKQLLEREHEDDFSNELKLKSFLSDFSQPLKERLEKEKNPVYLEAMRRIQYLRVYHEACDFERQNDFLGLYLLYKANLSFFRNYKVPNRLRVFLEDVKRISGHIESIETHIKNHPEDIEGMLDLWKKFPELHGTTLVNYEIAPGKPLKDFICEAVEGNEIYKAMEASLEMEDLIELYNLWANNASLVSAHPRFRRFWGAAQKGKAVREKWFRFKKAALESEFTDALQSFDEELFRSQALKEGLIPQIKKIIPAAIAMKASFQESPLQGVFAFGHSFLVRFMWPSSAYPIEHVLIAASKSEYPIKPSDHHNSFDVFVKRGSKESCTEVWFPRKDGSLFVSIWPAIKIFDELVPIGEALSLQPQESREVFYKFEFKGGFRQKKRLLEIWSDVDFDFKNLFVCSYPKEENDSVNVLQVLEDIQISKGRLKVLLDSFGKEEYDPSDLFLRPEDEAKQRSIRFVKGE